MGDLVEGLSEVQQDEVSLSLIFNSSCKIIDGQDKLGITRSSFPEAMLGIAEDLVFSQVVDDCTVDHMLTQLGHNGSQRDRSVVGW